MSRPGTTKQTEGNAKLASGMPTPEISSSLRKLNSTVSRRGNFDALGGGFYRGALKYVLSGHMSSQDTPATSENKIKAQFAEMLGIRYEKGKIVPTLEMLFQAEGSFR